MKKSIFMFILLILMIVNVNADSFKLHLVGEDTFDGAYELLVAVDSSETICGITTDFSYDTNILKIREYSGLNGFNAVIGNGKIVIDSDNCVTSGNVMKIVFEPLNGFENGSKTSINFTNIVSGDGDNIFNASAVSKEITKEDASPNTGSFASPIIAVFLFVSIVMYILLKKERKFI